MKRIIKLAIDDEDGFGTVLEAIRSAQGTQVSGESVAEFRGRMAVRVCRHYLDSLRQPAKPSGEAKT